MLPVSASRMAMRSRGFPDVFSTIVSLSVWRSRPKNIDWRRRELSVQRLRKRNSKKSGQVADFEAIRELVTPDDERLYVFVLMWSI